MSCSRRSPKARRRICDFPIGDLLVKKKRQRISPRARSMTLVSKIDAT
jgi:hypothetical protein